MKNFIEDIIENLPLILSLIMSFSLVIVTYNLWKESARTAKLQLLNYYSNIVEKSMNQLVSQINEFGNYVKVNNKNGIDSSFNAFKTQLLYINNIHPYYRILIERVDKQYKCKGEFKNALIHKSKEYEKSLNGLYMAVRKEFDRLASEKGYDKTEYYYDVLGKLEDIIDSMKKLLNE